MKMNLKKQIFVLSTLLVTTGAIGVTSVSATQVTYVKTSSVTYYLNNVSTGTTDYYDYVNILHGGSYTTTTSTIYYTVVNSVGQSQPAKQVTTYYGIGVSYLTYSYLMIIFD